MYQYPRSIHRIGETTVSMVRGEDADYLKVEGPNPGFAGACAEGEGLYPLDHANTALLRKLFPFCAPKPVLTAVRTVGVGDRLGLATAASLSAAVDTRAYAHEPHIWRRARLRDASRVPRGLPEGLWRRR